MNGWLRWGGYLLLCVALVVLWAFLKRGRLPELRPCQGKPGSIASLRRQALPPGGPWFHAAVHRHRPFPSRRAGADCYRRDDVRYVAGHDLRQYRGNRRSNTGLSAQPFFAGRWLQERFGQQLDRFNRELERHGHNYLLILRIIPAGAFLHGQFRCRAHRNSAQDLYLDHVARRSPRLVRLFLRRPQVRNDPIAGRIPVLADYSGHAASRPVCPPACDSPPLPILPRSLNLL